jgi:hypothetical protein
VRGRIGVGTHHCGPDDDRHDPGDDHHGGDDHDDDRST